LCTPSGAIAVGGPPWIALILQIEDAINKTCPWSGKPIAADSLTRYRGMVVGFCNPGCRDKFARAIEHFHKEMRSAGGPQSVAKGSTAPRRS
jgi:hypothetical protein